LLDHDVPPGLGGPHTVLGANGRRRGRHDDLDSVVAEEIVQGRVLSALDAVRAQHLGRLAGGPVVDSHDLGQRAIAERLDVLGGAPARAQDANAILLCHLEPPWRRSPDSRRGSTRHRAQPRLTLLSVAEACQYTAPDDLDVSRAEREEKAW